MESSACLTHGHTLHRGCKSIPQGDYYDPLQIFSLSEQYFKQHEKYIFFRLRNVYVCCWENRLLGYQFQNQIPFGFDLVYKYTSNNPAFLLNFIADPPCWNIWFAIPLWSAIRTLKIFETSQHIMLDGPSPAVNHIKQNCLMINICRHIFDNKETFSINVLSVDKNVSTFPPVCGTKLDKFLSFLWMKGKLTQRSPLIKRKYQVFQTGRHKIK